MIGIIVLFIFAIFDYIFYNTFNRINSKYTDGLFSLYRIIQYTFQAILIVVLFYFFGTVECLIFIILHWTFWADFIYYCLYDLLSFYKSNDYSRFKSEYFGNQIRWAFWTPFGLIQLFLSGKENGMYRIMKWQYLIIQQLIGIAISIYIL